MVRQPLHVLVVFGNHHSRCLRCTDLLLTSVAFDAECRLMTHRAVLGRGVGALFVFSRLEGLRVVGGLELEVLGVAREAVLGGNLAGSRVGEAVASVARQHVRAPDALKSVPELRVAHRTLVVALEMLGVGKDHATWQKVVDIGVAVHALTHRCRLIGIDVY